MKIYSLSILDEGILQDQYAHPNLITLFVAAYSHIIQFVSERHGRNDDKVYTDDGYAKITELLLDGQNWEHVWNYNFDGQESLKENIQQELKSLLEKQEYRLTPAGIRQVERYLNLKDLVRVYDILTACVGMDPNTSLEVIYHGFIQGDNALDGIRYNPIWLSKKLLAAQVNG